MGYNTQYIHFEALSNFVLKEFHLKHFGLYISVSRSDSSFLASLFNNSFFLFFLNSPFFFSPPGYFSPLTLYQFLEGYLSNLPPEVNISIICADTTHIWNNLLYYLSGKKKRKQKTELKLFVPKWLKLQFRNKQK